MKRIMVRERTPVLPFGEPACNLRILNKPLWLLQRDLLARHCKGVLEIDNLNDIPATNDDELLVCKDNLFFNAALIDTFIAEARAMGQACQIAFHQNDRAIDVHARHLQKGIRLEEHASEHSEQSGVYVADLYYFPPGPRQQPQPLVIDTQAYEMGYYHIPSYMAHQGDLVFQVPNRVFLSIENWVHVYMANTPMGVFNWARQTDEQMQRASLLKALKWKWTDEDRAALLPKLKLVATAFLERVNPFEEEWRNHFLASKELVKVGKNCSIDPTAIIHGPTVIGDNVYIGPGAVITNSLIGSNVNIMQGAQVMLSVISDRCFLPFRSGVFMSSMMENSMVAQNTTLQVCVVGRNTFVGANNVFTDFHLRGEPIRTYHDGALTNVGMPVLGSAVGHNCKIGSGFVFYPGRMVGSNTVLILDNDVNLIDKSVNVPGLGTNVNIPGYGPSDDNDEGGEVQRTIYRWPYIVDPDTGELRDPSDTTRQRVARPDDPPPAGEDSDHAYSDNTDPHVVSRASAPPDTGRSGLSDALEMPTHVARTHEVRIGG